MITVGQRLHDERVRMGLTIEEVAKATRIRASFISALESGDYSKLPSRAYAMGFIKNYISFLGLPQREFVARFRREYVNREDFGVLPKSLTRSGEIKPRRINLFRSLVIASGILIVVVSYLLFQYRAAIFDPRLIVSSPKEGQTINSDNLVVRGNTDANAIVSVDGAAVSVDTNGNFSKNLTVFSGEESIVVKAVNSFGRLSSVVVHVTVR